MKRACCILLPLWAVWIPNEACAQEPPPPEPYSNEFCARALPLSREQAKHELAQQIGTDLPTHYYLSWHKRHFLSIEAFRSRVDGSPYHLALAIPETGETLVVEHPRRRDLPSRRLWLFDDKGGKKEVELPTELRAPPLIDGTFVQYDWRGLYYPWSSHRMFLLYTSKGLYGLRDGKIWLISGASKLSENHSFDSGGGFHDLGPGLDAIIFGTPLGPTPYIVINEKKGVIRSEQLPDMKNGGSGEPHPDGRSLIVFAKGRAYRVATDAPATEITPSNYPATFAAFAGTTIPWWPGTILSTTAGFRLLGPSGDFFRIRGMDSLDPKRTYITFGEARKRVYFWTAPFLELFGEIVTVASSADCAG